MAKSSESDALAILFPGREMSIGHGESKINIKVYPMGVSHVRRFNQAVEEVLPKIASQVPLNQLGTDLDLSRLGPMVIPILISDVLDLINACVEGVDLMNPRFPHWELAPIIGVWIEESFGEEKKIRPWIEVVEQTIERMTGENPKIWATLSKSLSRTGTTSTSSSMDSGPDALIEDGPSPSSS